MRTTTTAMVGSPTPSYASEGVDASDNQAYSTTSNGASGVMSYGGARYSWNDDPEKSFLLMELVTDAFLRKPADRRYVRTSEWEHLFQEFNRQASAPVESVKILHNRLGILRTQCRDYHEVLKAQRRGELETDDDWKAFAKNRSIVRKWQRAPFEFYDEMVECLRAQGELLDGDDGDSEQPPRERGGGGTNANATASAGSGRTPSAVTPPVRRRPAQAQNSEESSRNVRRRLARAEARAAARGVGGATTLPQRVSLPTASPALVTVSPFVAALHKLAKLQLPLEMRVDAKRFLVDEKNAQAFIHMDEEEQHFYLNKYCFDTSHHQPQPQQQQQDQDHLGPDEDI